MHICTITCNNADNYGARLQTFALQHFLESLGHTVQVIDYEPDYMGFGTRLWYNPGFNVKEWAKLFLQYRQRRLSIRKHLRLEEFSRRYLHLTDKYTSVDHLRKLPPAADVYMAGSDQIWNTDFPNGKDPAYYLDFGPDDVKRVSYAASFALPEIKPELKPFVRDELSKLDGVSVREASAMRIVHDLGMSATLVCDPVFLLDADFWGGDFASDISMSGEYVLVYDFERSPQLRWVAMHIARVKGLKIYSVSPWPLSYADRNFCDCSPEEFVALFRDARYVVSNSLHGSIFSVIFRKDFFVVNRADGLNVRMSDLLDLLGINDRIVNPYSIRDALDVPLDYKAIYTLLDPLIQTSKSLLNNIGDRSLCCRL